MKKKTKVGDIDIREVVTCPSYELYSFQGKCAVSTCQYHTDRTEHNCLALDRKSGDLRSFTDKELRYFKCRGHTLREVSGLRRTGMQRIRCITALYCFIEYIRENYKKKSFDISPELDNIVSTSYLRFKKLKFHNWMLVHLIDDKLFTSFKRKEGIPSDITLVSMLGLTRTDYKQFVALMQKSLPK